jgi:hypothetical protein
MHKIGNARLSSVSVISLKDVNLNGKYFGHKVCALCLFAVYTRNVFRPDKCVASYAEDVPAYQIRVHMMRPLCVRSFNYKLK